MIKAQIWETFYSEPHWLEQTIQFYEYALNASRNASILFKFANFLQKHNKLDKALELYEEALSIYRKLAMENPATFLPRLAMTLINMSAFYFESVPNREKSISLAQEVVAIGKGFEQVPVVQSYVKKAIEILEKQGVDLE